MSWREGLLSIGTTAGVLVLGVLPGVILAVLLSLCWLIMVISRPPGAVLGHVPGVRGFHSIADYPQARTVPGLLIFRFEADLLFFNIDYFRERLEAAIRAADGPVEWVIVDAAPINWIDGTAIQHLQELRQQLALRDIQSGLGQGAPLAGSGLQRALAGRPAPRRRQSQLLDAQRGHRRVQGARPSARGGGR